MAAGEKTRLEVLWGSPAGSNRRTHHVVEPNLDTESLRVDLKQNYVAQIDLLVRVAAQGIETC